jgi:hypothetical protein
MQRLSSRESKGLSGWKESEDKKNEKKCISDSFYGKIEAKSR